MLIIIGEIKMQQSKISFAEVTPETKLHQKLN